MLTDPDPITTDSAPAPADTPSGYRDDEIVYVDPDSRIVVGRLEWTRSGNPKSMPVIRAIEPPVPEVIAEKAEPSKTPAVVKPPDKPERRRGSGRKYYPFGTYKSMKNVYKLEGKQKKGDPNQTLEEILPKALEQAFWD